MTEERPRKRRAVATHSNGNHVPDNLQHGVHGISMRPATAMSHHQQERVRQAEYQREVDVVRFEVEPVKVKTPSNTHAVKYVPTMRGMLGQKGYILREKLGKGSYSQVRLAINVPRLQTVAIKIVDKTLAPKDFRERFLPRELEIWPRLRHPHIVRMFHHFEDTRRIYAVLEYAPGGDALRFIQKRGALSTDHAKIWMLQLGDAVRYLHQQDIAHRDLKLENLILDAASNLKLCDFGFARECGSDLSSTYCGSKSYAAPEILSGTQYDPKKADIWALGVILFIFVTGKMPFDERKGNTGLLEDHKSLKFYWPTKVSDHCKDVILSSLKFEFSNRLDIVAFMSQVWFQTLSGVPYSCPRQVADIPVAHTSSDPMTRVSSHSHPRHHSATNPQAAQMSDRQASEYRTHNSSHPHRQQHAAAGQASTSSQQRHSHLQTLVTMSPDINK